MKFRNCIGEFFLFRWLFGSHKHNDSKHDVSDTTIFPDDSDFANGKDSHIGYDNQDYDYSQSLEDFFDEQDEYDMMDDDF